MGTNLETLFLETALEPIINEASGRCNQRRATYIQKKLIEAFKEEIVSRNSQKVYDELIEKYSLTACEQKQLKDQKRAEKIAKQDERLKLKKQALELKKKELAIRAKNEGLRKNKYDDIKEDEAKRLHEEEQANLKAQLEIQKADLEKKKEDTEYASGALYRKILVTRDEELSKASALEKLRNYQPPWWEVQQMESNEKQMKYIKEDPNFFVPNDVRRIQKEHEEIVKKKQEHEEVIRKAELALTEASTEEARKKRAETIKDLETQREQVTKTIADIKTELSNIDAKLKDLQA
jgi:hypothetical protein